MQRIIGILALAMALGACTASEPHTDQTQAPLADPAGRVVEVDTAGSAVGADTESLVGRTLVHQIPAVDTASIDELSSPTLAPVETSSEPWLTSGFGPATIGPDPDADPRLQTVDERIPSNDGRMPLAVSVVAERPSRPHEHTHSGTE